MSRMVYFALNGTSMGELTINCSRAYAINASPPDSKVKIPAAAVTPDLELGRMVMIEHPTLPAWAGMIDTPWSALTPVEMTLYSAAYLLHLRSPERGMSKTGTVGDLAMMLVSTANSQGDLFIRAGHIDADTAARQSFDLRDCWTQLTDLVKKKGMEMRFRPVREAGKLVIYMDIQKRLGVDTGYLLHDGPGANMVITKAAVDGEIWNRIIGYSSGEKTILSAQQIDSASVNRYRMRSKNVQFQGVSSVAILNDRAKTQLLDAKGPYLYLTVSVLKEAFPFIDLGNSALVHAANLYLPGGRHGWRGPMRINAMAYDEPNDRCNLNLEAQL
jgi:hypothetical protein